MPKDKTKKQEEQDLKEAMSHFKELAPPDEDENEVDDVEVITNTELTKLIEEQAIDGISYADRKSVPPDDDDDATDTELDDNKNDKPAIDYFKDLAVADEDEVDDEPVSHHTIRDRDYYEKQDTEIRQAYLEGLADGIAQAEDMVYKESLLPTRLQEMQQEIPSGVEENWIVHIWNKVIDAKLYLKNKTKNTYITKPDGTRIKKQKYRKTKEADKVSSYRVLRNRYKNKQTWATMELKIRKMGFYALDMGNLYNASQWSSFISSNQDVDEFDDMLDNICNQLYEGFKI